MTTRSFTGKGIPRSWGLQGNALFERNWPYAWSLHQAPGSKVKGVTGAAPLPAFTPGRGTACLGGWHVGLSRYGDAAAEGAMLIGFLTSYEIQQKIALPPGTAREVRRLGTGRILPGLRPERVRISGDPGPPALRGIVASVENLGRERLVSVETGGGVLTVLTDEEAPKEGDAVGLALPLETASVFRPEDGE